MTVLNPENIRTQATDALAAALHRVVQDRRYIDLGPMDLAFGGKESFLETAADILYVSGDVAVVVEWVALTPEAARSYDSGMDYEGGSFTGKIAPEADR